MSDVIVQWKIKGAIMTPYGAMPRIARDQDMMSRQKATDLARCGFVEVLGDAGAALTDQQAFVPPRGALQHAAEEGKKVSDVLVRWKVRGAVMTPYGAMPRAAGDQDMMDQQKATNLVRCGFVDVLGKPESVVAKMADVLENNET